jgi:GNAT superfamily N-acetyltransferase
MTVEIIPASDTNSPDQTVAAAFTLFEDVYKKTPSHLGNFLSATLADFQINKTIVARPTGSDDVCGVIVCDTEPKFCHPLYKKFNVQNKILDILKLKTLQGITLLSSLAVSDNYRRQGIATKLYDCALEKSQHRCICLILKENKIGNTVSEKSGFHDIPSLDFIQNYRRDGKKIVMDDQGDLTCHWQMITTLNI